MLYDEKCKRGIRKKCLPNPTKTTFPRDATLNDIFEKAIHLFYQDFKPISNDDVTLVDSSGNKIALPENFKLGDYYIRNQLVPSRHKFYTMLQLKKVNLVL